MNEWMSEYLLRAGSEDMILRKNRSACCPHEVYDLVGEGIMKEIITKQRSNFYPDKQWCQDVKDEESMRSRGERSCTGINTRAEGTRRDRERGGKEQTEVIKAWAENVWGKGCELERWGHGKMGLSKKIIYLFLAGLGRPCRLRAFSSCREPERLSSYSGFTCWGAHALGVWAQ